MNEKSLLISLCSHVLTNRNSTSEALKLAKEALTFIGDAEMKTTAESILKDKNAGPLSKTLAVVVKNSIRINEQKAKALKQRAIADLQARQHNQRNAH